MRRIRFVSPAEVIAIHDDEIYRWGGQEGSGHRGNAYEGVEAAVLAVRNSYYETIFELAAAYAVYIVQGHPFMDGNKRAALGTALVFLHGNGVSIVRNDEALQEAMVNLQRWCESRKVGPDEAIERIARIFEKQAKLRR